MDPESPTYDTLQTCPTITESPRRVCLDAGAFPSTLHHHHLSCSRERTQDTWKPPRPQRSKTLNPSNLKSSSLRVSSLCSSLTSDLCVFMCCCHCSLRTARCAWRVSRRLRLSGRSASLQSATCVGSCTSRCRCCGATSGSCAGEQWQQPCQHTTNKVVWAMCSSVWELE